MRVAGRLAAEVLRMIGPHVQAATVDTALFREFVVKMNANLLAAAHPDGGPQVAAAAVDEMPRLPFDQSPLVGPNRCRPSRQNRAFRHGGLEGQFDIRFKEPIGSGLGSSASSIVAATSRLGPT